ncbi:M56 family metallopeptidase [Gillisia limnaea]|uniref:Peptidase M56 BlaR1 n=1 Tax=Gillisia limnaea (strain DSM 15749 / LMG 21470 / R-8282) TaxID=865937 RepID=H2BY35_GILLR|nr:M56 family metallopeptidase [Gillisia limnaea]EHQ03241.1 peptidase M56 BlaR1 [Gillisia limnaea DSM 15749]
MLVYILQVILFQLLFLLVYEGFLKKETFFTYNRWYLLSTSIFAFLLPLIKIEVFSTLVPAESIAAITNVWLPEVFIGNTPQEIQYLPAVEISRESNFINWWFIAYGVGAIGSLFLLLRKYQNLNRLFSFKPISSEKDLRIIEVPNSTIACTFYKTVFLGDKLSEVEKQQILSHELVHVKQKHSLDLVFFEVLRIIFWFNPLIYIYQNKIATVHEFIADEAVVKNTGKLNYYEQLLNSAFNTQNISFINQFFNHSLIKKRIVMLQKSKSRTIAKFKYLVILPLMLVMLTVVSCTQDDPQPMAGEESLLEQLNKLKITLEESEEISEEEKRKIIEIKLAADEAIQEYIRSKGTDDSGITTIYEQVPGENKNELGPDVPFAVIEEVPVYPGCENLGSNEEKKKCMSEKITEHVNKNFNTGLGKELNLSGKNRVIVQFKIDKNGNITDVRSRAPHPSLEVEAERVINSLPAMEPGKQRGEEVGVMYSLPIVFQVGE